jgi:hypothetical protein
MSAPARRWRSPRLRVRVRGLAAAVLAALALRSISGPNGISTKGGESSLGAAESGHEEEPSVITSDDGIEGDYG